eukprot:7384165-Prymnesium_polylepis.1
MVAAVKKGLGARRKSLVSKESLGEQERATRALYEQYRPAGHDGLLLEDLSQALEKLHLPRSRIEEIFKRADTDGDGSECTRSGGVITYEEFSAHVNAHEASLRTAFEDIDVDHSGSLSTAEVQQLMDRLQMSCSEARRDEIMRAMDLTGNGEVSYEEFRTVFALLDPDDLLLALDDHSAFSDYSSSEVADIIVASKKTKALVRKMTMAHIPASTLPAPPYAAAVQPKPPVVANR